LEGSSRINREIRTLYVVLENCFASEAGRATLQSPPPPPESVLSTSQQNIITATLPGINGRQAVGRRSSHNAYAIQRRRNVANRDRCHLTLMGFDTESPAVPYPGVLSPYDHLGTSSSRQILSMSARIFEINAANKAHPFSLTEAVQKMCQTGVLEFCIFEGRIPILRAS
jgi:hypothetical protein